MLSFFTFCLRKKLCLLGIVFVLLGMNSAKATHLMGGDLTYACLGGNTYQFTLTLYRDCRGIDLSTTNQRIVMFSNSCGIQETNIDLTFQSFQEITPICPAQQGNSACNGGPVPGVEEYVFTATVTLPQQCNDWTFYYVRCCRNGAITNLQNPNDQRIYIEATLNNLDVSCNSSPVFTNKPVPFLCSGSPFLYNNGAIDPDGDSLAFMLIPPRNKDAGNPANDINFTSNYSPTYPLTTAPANAFNFDQLSGQMDFTPNGLQQAVVTVLVKEYRNGVLIGTVLRDIQLVVLNCANQLPILDPPSNVAGATLNGNTFSVCAGNTLSFNLGGSDPDVANLLTFTSDILQALPGATFTQTTGNPISASISWPTTLSDTGSYFISFLLKDDGCPLIASQVVGFNIIVAPGVVYPPQNNYICPLITTTLPLQTNIPNNGGTYQWTPATGLSNPNIPNPIATIPLSGTATYFVTYTDGITGCPVNEQINILPAGIVSVPDTVQVCEGDSVALAANFQQFGANNPFTFSWDPPTGLSNTTIGNPMASPATTTAYTVTASTVNCAFSTNVVVEVTPLPDLLPIQDETICQNDSVQLLASGNDLTGATYSWSPVVGISTPNVLSPSVSPNSTQTYTLTATNQCGSDTEQVTVTVFSPLSVSLSTDEVSCNGGNDGAITAIVTGGNGNPAYLWTPGGSTNNSLTNLVAGTYSVSVSDAAGCNATASVALTEPTPLVGAILGSTNIDCFGANNGTISLGASGGTPPYKYALNGGAFQSSANFTGLAPGSYNLVVRDANLCETPFGPVTLLQPAAPLDLTLISTIAAGCNGVPGQISVAASGGTAPYQFGLNNGALQISGIFNGLTPGVYSVRAVDANGCTDLLSVNVFSITDPIIVLDSVGPVSCLGGTDGIVRVSASGGMPPYLISIDGGVMGTDTLFTGLTAGLHQVYLEDASVPSCSFTLNVNVPTPTELVGSLLNQENINCFGGVDGEILLAASGGTSPYQYAFLNGTFSTDSLFPGIGAGVYSMHIRDANGCLDTVGVSLTEPPVLDIQGVSDSTACFGDANGGITVTTTGGTPRYEYSFNGGPFVIDTSFSGLSAGDYQVLVLDRQGCMDSVVVMVEEPDLLTVAVDNILEIACFGDSTGQISVVGSGGTLPYTFRLPPGIFGTDDNFVGLPMGSYQIQIRDENGCVAAVDTLLTEPEKITGTIMTTNISCFGANDGTAEMQVQGGISPFTYAWSDNGPPLALRPALGPGAFWAEATDANGCFITFLGEIVEPEAVSFDSTDVVDVACFGESTGEVLISVSGGILPYTYTWSNGATDSAQVGVPADTYFVTVTDSNDCEIMDTLIVTEPPVLEIAGSEIMDAFCDWDNGELSVSVIGGTPPYLFEWAGFPGMNTNILFGLNGGDSIPPYQLRITDSLGCEVLDAFFVDREPAPLAAFVTDPFTNDTLLLSDEPIAFINQSQFAVTYFWEFGDGAGSDEFSPFHTYRNTGIFPVQLIAYDERFLCPDTANLNLVVIPPGSIYFPNAFTPNGDGHNEYFYPVGEGIVSLELTIFDRWGHVIRRINGIDAKWDGTMESGNAVQEGVYVYVAQVRLNDGTVFKRAGTATLIR